MSNDQEAVGSPTPRSLKAAVMQLAQRVDRVTRIVQVEGDYEVDLSVDRSGKRVVTAMEPIVTASLDEGRLQVSATFELMAATEAGRGYARVKAGFVVAYDFAPPLGEEYTQEEMDAFAKLNAVFNLTAYWREFVHGSLARAGLPPFIIEPFNALRAMDRLDPPPSPPSSPDAGSPVN